MQSQFSLGGLKQSVEVGISNIDASQVTTGVLAVARGGTGVAAATGTGSVVLNTGPTFAGTAAFGALVASNAAGVSNLHAANVAAGTLAVARGGTGVNTSTGTGSVVLSTGPTFAGTAAFAAVDASNVICATANISTLSSVNAAGVSNLNAANVTAGTLAVARGGTGVGTSTGTGSVVLSTGPTFAGTAAFATLVASNAAGVSNLDAGNVATGTLAVARGGTGVATSTGTGSVVLSTGPTFAGTAAFATLVASNAAGVSNLNAANVASGTLAVARGGTGVGTSTGTGSVVLSTGPTFAGTAVFATLTATDGSGVSNLSAANVATGTLPVARGGTGVATSTGTGSVVLSTGPTFAGTAAFATLTATDGSGVSNLSAANVATGTLPVARGGTGVTASTGTGSVVLNTGPTFAGTAAFATLTATDGSGVSNLSAANVATGTLPVARGGTGVTASTGTGSVVLSTGPTFAGTAAFATLVASNAAGVSNLDAGNVATGTLAVARGGTGVTASTGTGSVVLSTGPTFAGTAAFATLVASNAAGVSNLDAGNVATGTLAVARGGTGVTASTGTGSVVLSTGPTFAGTAAFATLVASNAAGVSNLDAGNVATGTLAVARGGTGVTASTGTGSVVLSAAPVLTGTAVLGSVTLSNGGNSNAPALALSNLSTGLWTQSNGIGFATSASNRIFISNTGFVGIGMAPNPAYTLAVGASNSSAIGIHTEGDIQALSDARYKFDVQRIGGALDKIERVGGYTYRRRFADGSETQRRLAGVLAQEVREVLPEVVTEDAEGVLAVAYGNMIALAIEAIKELRADVRALQLRAGP